LRFAGVFAFRFFFVASLGFQGICFSNPACLAE
jgi:hypothetical protein